MHTTGEILTLMNDIANDFGEIAKRVNVSSKMRKNHSSGAIKSIIQTRDICSILIEEMEGVASSNKVERNQKAIILTECDKMKLTLEKQKVVLEQITEKELLTNDIIKKATEIIDSFDESLEEAMLNLNKLIGSDNEIVFLDDELIESKKMQQVAIEKLLIDAETSLLDAEKAIEGSASNLDRGLKMVDKYKTVENLLGEKNRKELNELYVEANRGWNIAVDVNKCSIAQLDFAENVNSYTSKLYSYSERIKTIVESKHSLFEQNLQVFTVLTVILTMKFRKYLELDKLLVEEDVDFDKDVHLYKFSVLTNILNNDISDLISLSYNMTDNSHLNNENENRTVELTQKEMETFLNIKEQVEFMTEATRIPIDGSNKNISNGQHLEQLLKSLIDEIEEA